MTSVCDTFPPGRHCGMCVRYGYDLGFRPFFWNFTDLYSDNMSAPQREVKPYTPPIYRVPLAVVYQ